MEKVSATLEDTQSALEGKVTTEFEGSERMNFASLYLDVKAKLTRQLNMSMGSDAMHRSSSMRQFSLDGSSFRETNKSR